MTRASRLVVPAAVLSAFAAMTGVARAATATQTYTTPGEHAFTVPAGVSSLQVMLVGGNGGAGRFPGSAGGEGGQGATLQATLAVTPGETLYAEVAGNGEPGASAGSGRGGAGGGANGGEIFLSKGGGGGGGASDLRTCPLACAGSSLHTRLIVAAGGGGGGGEGGPAAVNGGSGGAADRSGTSGSRNVTLAGGERGSRGTASSGGAGGAFSFECPTIPAACAAAGTEGGGGSGGVGLGGGGGGGGGGGIFGGGGGGGGEGFKVSLSEFENAGGGGGGGGSSGVPATGSGRVSGLLQLLTVLGAEPSISIGWTVPAPSPPAGNPSPSAGGASAAAPSLAGASGLSLSPARFRRGSHLASISRAKLPIGTMISFELTQSATVTLAFEQALSGVRSGARCLAASRPPRHGKPCTRWVRVAHTIIRQAHAGADRVHFEGVLDGGARLSAGRYRVSLAAADAAGSTSAAGRPGFTLLS